MDRYLTCRPSLESLLSPPAQAPAPWVNRKTRGEHTCPKSTTALCAPGRDPPCTITQNSSSVPSTALPGSSCPHSNASLQFPPPPCHRAGLYPVPAAGLWSSLPGHRRFLGFQATHKHCLLHDMRKGQGKREFSANIPWE